MIKCRGQKCRHLPCNSLSVNYNVDNKKDHIMKKILLVMTLSIMFATFVTPAYSSDHKKKYEYSGHFGDMDLDGDDSVDWKEFKNYFPHAKKDVFKKADGNNDGSIDHDEWHEFKDEHGYGHKE